MSAPDEGNVDPLAFTKLVAAEVRKCGREHRFIRQSSDWRMIDAMHAIHPRIRIYRLRVDRVRQEYLELPREHHVVGICGDIVRVASPNTRRG